MTPPLLFYSQIRAIPMNHSNARAALSAYPYNIYAMEHQIVTMATTKTRDSAQLVSWNGTEETRDNDIDRDNDISRRFRKVLAHVDQESISSSP